MFEVSTVLEWIGALLGVIGALLLALNMRFSQWGWVAFLVSNIFLITYTVLTGQWGLLTMQLIFTGTSVLGIYRWFWVYAQNHTETI